MLSYHGLFSYILSWSVLSSPVFQAPCSVQTYHGQFYQVLCYKLPVLVRSIMTSFATSYNQPWLWSVVSSSPYSVILSWSVLSSPVLQAPCFGQIYHDLFCYILQPAMIMVSCIKLPVFSHPIMVSSIKSCVTSSLFCVILQLTMVMAGCIKLPVLCKPIMVLSSVSSSKSCVASSSYSAILSWPVLTSPVLQAPCSGLFSCILSWPVLTSPVLQAPCSEQPFLSSSIRSYHGQF